MVTNNRINNNNNNINHNEDDNGSTCNDNFLLKNLTVSLSVYPCLAQRRCSLRKSSGSSEHLSLIEMVKLPFF